MINMLNRHKGERAIHLQTYLGVAGLQANMRHLSTPPPPLASAAEAVMRGLNKPQTFITALKQKPACGFGYDFGLHISACGINPCFKSNLLLL